MRTIYGRLHDWKGESAEKLSRMMEGFLQGTTVRIQELDTHTEQLQRYISNMEIADRYQQYR